MTTKKTLTELANTTSVCDDYDPNSMPVEQAREYIKAFLTTVKETERLHLHAALGRVLAEEILASHNVPNHDNSAMDGYAFNANDLEQGTTRLKITGAAFAGNALTGNFEKGACVRIMTGAAIPAGADTVIAQERVELDGEFIQFTDTPNRGANVRYAGEDLKARQIVLNVGHQISPADLGLIASLGIGEVSVYRKLKVSFFSTGDELASIGSTLKTGQIFDSNR
ncbi:MAG: molybdopterin molybdenumtransferase MoeA, partial [Methylocystaceae bacterium]|nr:molybdopterin molybdenumtransferase MoeA [Methylocystaceae bacterium]